MGWIGTGMVSSLLMGGTEYLISILIVVFLFTLKLVEAAKIPSWLFDLIKDITPTQACLTLVVVGSLRAGSQFVARHCSYVVWEFVRARLHLIQGYQMLAMDWNRSLALSQINTRMGECFPKTAEVVLNVAELLLNSTLALCFALAMFAIAWREAMLGLLCLSCAGLLIYFINHSLRRLGSRIPSLRLRIERALIRVHRNWLLIRVMRLRKYEYQAYLNGVLDYFKYQQKILGYRALASVLPPLLGIIALVVIIQSSQAFQTPSVELLGFIYMFVRFTQAANAVTDRLSTIINYWSQTVESLDLIASLPPEDLRTALGPSRELSLLGRKNTGRDHLPDLQENGMPSRSGQAAAPAIEVRDVTYAWPGAATPVFANLSIEVPGGTIFGIIGPNGSGKSTMLGLILGVLRPSSGQVIIGGMDGEDYVNKYGTVGFVGEDNHLIQGTVQDNLQYGLNGGLDEADLREALQLVGLAGPHHSGPDFLEATIQENGDGLSAGQKQRLALARAFLRRPSLLVLDEASSNLDDAAEAELAGILHKLKGRCTMLVVAHKPGILKYADNILNVGRIGDATKPDQDLSTTPPAPGD